MALAEPFGVGKEGKSRSSSGPERRTTLVTREKEGPERFREVERAARIAECADATLCADAGSSQDEDVVRRADSQGGRHDWKL